MWGLILSKMPRPSLLLKCLLHGCTQSSTEAGSPVIESVMWISFLLMLHSRPGHLRSVPDVTGNALKWVSLWITQETFSDCIVLLFIPQWIKSSDLGYEFYLFPNYVPWLYVGFSSVKLKQPSKNVRIYYVSSSAWLKMCPSDYSELWLNGEAWE